MRKYLQPEFLFAITGLLILILGILFFHSTLDIAIHDTYIVIGHQLVAGALFIIFLLIAFIYFVFKKTGRPLNSVSGWTHFLLTTVPLTVANCLQFSPQRYHPYEDHADLWANAELYGSFLAIAIVLCALGQVLFLITIIIALLKRKKSKSQ